MEKRSRDDGDAELTLDDIPGLAASFHDGMDDDPTAGAAREMLGLQRSPDGDVEEFMGADLPARIIAGAFSASQIDVDPRSPLGVTDVTGNRGISAEIRAILERVETSEVADPENMPNVDQVAAELEVFDRILKKSPSLPGIRDSGAARDQRSRILGPIGKPAKPASSASGSSGIVYGLDRPGDGHVIDDLIYRPDERKPGEGIQLLSAMRVPASNESATPEPLLQLEPPSTQELSSGTERAEPESVTAPQEPEPLSMTRPIVLVDLDQSNRFYEAALDEFADRIDGLAQAHAKDALEYFKWELTAEMRALEGFY